MHLLYCKNCGDIYNVKGSSNKTCGCEATGGIEENGVVKYYGDPFPLELDDETLSSALLHHIQQLSNTSQKVNLLLLPPNTPKFIQQ